MKKIVISLISFVLLVGWSGFGHSRGFYGDDVAAGAVAGAIAGGCVSLLANTRIRPVVIVEPTPPEIIVEPEIFYDGPFIVGGVPYWYYDGGFFIFEGGAYRFHHHCPSHLRGDYDRRWHGGHRDHLRTHPPQREQHDRSNVHQPKQDPHRQDPQRQGPQHQQ